MSTAKDRGIIAHTMTKREWIEYVEEKGHPPSWPPNHSHSPTGALNNQRHPHNNGSNQVPPARAGHTHKFQH